MTAIINLRKQRINADRPRGNDGRFTLRSESPSVRRVTIRISDKDYALLDFLCDFEKKSQRAVIMLALQEYYTKLTPTVEGKEILSFPEAVD